MRIRLHLTHLAGMDAAGGGTGEVRGVLVCCRLPGGAGGEEADRSSCALAGVGRCCVGVGWGWGVDGLMNPGEECSGLSTLPFYTFPIRHYILYGTLLLGTFYRPKKDLAVLRGVPVITFSLTIINM